jgi:hypothetical protein
MESIISRWFFCMSLFFSPCVIHLSLSLLPSQLWLGCQTVFFDFILLEELVSRLCLLGPRRAEFSLTMSLVCLLLLLFLLSVGTPMSSAEWPPAVTFYL